MEKIIAVVVTYNRHALLKECIAALQKQTRPLDAILVINNGSTDSTEQWLAQQSDITHINQKNLGGAGGFRTGIETAYKKGYEWIWCMDDDGVPREDALEKLLEADNNDLRVLNCAVINKEDKRSFVWNTGGYKTLDEVQEDIIEGIGHPFNGTLISRRIIERIGLPKAEFFLWGDETEYYYRIVKRNKIPVCTVVNSVHYHPSTAFSLKKDWEFDSGWKMYFYLRNRFHVYKAKFNNKAIAFINYCCFIFAFAGVTMIYQKTNKFKKLSFIMWPVADAFNNNFEVTPPVILSKLKAKGAFSIPGSINGYLKNTLTSIFTPLSSLRARRAANV